ncbi:MAG: DNA methyltransferase [Bacteroidales bacterium]
MVTDNIKLSQIQVNGANPRIIKDEKFTKLVNSILVFPQMLELRPIVVDNTFVALGGNMRYRGLNFIEGLSFADLKARLADIKDFQKKTNAEQEALIAYWESWKNNPTAHVIKASELSDEQQKEFIIKDNVGYGEWDMDMLANEWDSEALDDWGLDVWQDETSDNGESSSSNSKPENGTLTDRFVVPPFSILDTRKGYWQARKKVWRELIGDMGESRNDTLITSPEIKYKDIYQKTREHRESLGLSFKEYLDKYVPDDVKEREASKVLSAGVSLLDPVMAELVCRWFGLENCKSFDCFAGDSVFGYVSSYLGNEFTGIEIRPEQAQLNNNRVAGMSARYICDDGQNVAQHIEPNSMDLLFSCPPYYDLEVYSDMENDASNQGTYDEFLEILTNAFKDALACLKENRFAVIVVGDVRDKKTGFYHNFVDDMKRIFKENGAALYNELILIETGASTALRAARYMESRKVAKMHQNILVFYKGSTKDIKTNFKKIEYASEDLELFSVDCGDEPAGAEE